MFITSNIKIGLYGVCILGSMIHFAYRIYQGVSSKISPIISSIAGWISDIVNVVRIVLGIDFLMGVHRSSPPLLIPPMTNLVNSNQSEEEECDTHENASLSNVMEDENDEENLAREDASKENESTSEIEDEGEEWDDADFADYEDDEDQWDKPWDLSETHESEEKHYVKVPEENPFHVVEFDDDEWDPPLDWSKIHEPTKSPSNPSEIDWAEYFPPEVEAYSPSPTQHIDVRLHHDDPIYDPKLAKYEWRYVNDGFDQGKCLVKVYPDDNYNDEYEIVRITHKSHVWTHPDDTPDVRVLVRRCDPLVSGHPGRPHIDLEDVIKLHSGVLEYFDDMSSPEIWADNYRWHIYESIYKKKVDPIPAKDFTYYYTWHGSRPKTPMELSQGYRG